MKLNAVILLFLMITSCSAQKADYDAVNDFLAVELKDLKYDTIHVQIEPYDAGQSIKLYERAYNERDHQNSKEAIVWTIPELEKWPFSEKDILLINKSLPNKFTGWTKNDFANKNFVYKNDFEIKNIDMIVSHLNSGTEEFVLKISRPIMSKDKKYALFQFHLTSFRIGYADTPNREAILMKKIKGKWVLLANIRQAAYD